jgi:hypothetical protein
MSLGAIDARVSSVMRATLAMSDERGAISLGARESAMNSSVWTFRGRACAFAATPGQAVSPPHNLRDMHAAIGTTIAISNHDPGGNKDKHEGGRRRRRPQQHIR